MVTKAVIAVAGLGTRFLPITKTINKCMLPIGTKPVVQYAVEDCISAGATHIAIVTAPGPPGDQVRHYFTPDPEATTYYRSRGWQDKLTPITGLPHLAEFTFLTQPRTSDRYGTAVPAMLARDFVGDDDFLLLAGDDLLLRTDGGSDLADLATARRDAATPAALAAATMPATHAHHYGVLSTTTSAGRLLLDQIVEKPASVPGDTAHIYISRALLPPSFFTYLDKLQPNPITGEYQATDAITAYSHDHNTLIHPITGQYHDCGNVTGWLTANNAIT